MKDPDHAAVPAPPAVASARTRPARRRLPTRGLLALPVLGAALTLPGVADPPVTPAPATYRLTAHSEATRSDVRRAEAFYDAGYSYDDAVALAALWGGGSSFEAKVEAGRFLEDGTALRRSPLADRRADDGRTDAELRALFFATGYTVDDAVVLAGRWDVDVPEAKARAGRELKTVGVLPFVDPAPDPASGS